MDNTRRRRLIKLDDGQYVAIEDTPSFSLSVETSTAKPIEDMEIEMNDKQFGDLMKQLKTEAFSSDTLIENTSIMRNDRPSEPENKENE